MAYIPGIDISEHQGAVDAHALGVAGIRHAIVRCADPARGHVPGHPPDGPVDPFYVSNVQSLREAGVPTDTYVYTRPSMERPATAAARYAAWARLVDEPGRLWLDFEGDPGLDPMSLALWALELVARLELDGSALGIYTNRWWDTHVDAAADELARLPLWHASYPFSEMTPPVPDEWETWAMRRPPVIARPWREAGEPWAIWQFTSSGTLVPGHGLDCNLVDPTLFTKDKPLPTPEVDVPICVPEWSSTTDPEGLRWEHYTLDGNLFSAWYGAPLPADSGAEQNQFLPVRTIDLTVALQGQKAFGPVMLNAGRLVGVYRQDGAPYFWATGREDPAPTPQPGIDEEALILRAAEVARQDIAVRLAR